MNDSVKVAGLCCSAVCFVVSLVVNEMNLAYAFAGVFGAILGLPVIGKGISKLAK